MAGRKATVLTVWQPYAYALIHAAYGFGWMPAGGDGHEIDEATRKSAEACAAEGAKLATEAGLDAQSRVTAQVTTTADAILDPADDVWATAIVMGSRGLTGIKSLLLGSVSRGDPARRPDRHRRSFERSGVGSRRFTS